MIWTFPNLNKNIVVFWNSKAKAAVIASVRSMLMVFFSFFLLLLCTTTTVGLWICGKWVNQLGAFEAAVWPSSATTTPAFIQIILVWLVMGRALESMDPGSGPARAWALLQNSALGFPKNRAWAGLRPKPITNNYEMLAGLGSWVWGYGLWFPFMFYDNGYQLFRNLTRGKVARLWAIHTVGKKWRNR